MICQSCGEFEAKTQIPNPNNWEDEPMFWDVCMMCKDVIEQQRLSMGSFITSRPYGKEIGEKMVEESQRRLNEISRESDAPIGAEFANPDNSEVRK